MSCLFYSGTITSWKGLRNRLSQSLTAASKVRKLGEHLTSIDIAKNIEQMRKEINEYENRKKAISTAYEVACTQVLLMFSASWEV